MYKCLSINIILIIFPIFIFSQIPDTSKIYSWKIDYMFDTIPTNIDTSLFGFQNFHPASTQCFSNAAVANNGQASIPNVFYKENLLYGNPYFVKFFWPYLINLSDLSFYNTRNPYTEGFYSIGQQKDQTLKILHTQNISSKLNVGFIYNLASVEGTFKRQKSRDNAVGFFSSYSGYRYNSHVSVGWNNLKTLVNGGLFSDSLFERTTEPTPTLEVKLNNAETDILKKSVSLNQTVNFFKIYNTKDTLKVHRDKFLFSLGHSVKYDYWAKTYTDLKAPLYKIWYFDAAKTKDSIRFKTLINTLYLQLNDYSLDWLSVGFNIGISQETANYGCYRYDTINYDTLYNNTILHAYFFNRSGKSINFTFGAKYYYQGFMKNDFNAIAEAKKYFNEKTDSCWLQLEFKMNRETPELFLQRYSSNNFFWYQNLLSSINESIKINFFSNKLHLDASILYSILDNYIIFDKFAMPHQMSLNFDVASLNITHSFHLKKVNFKNTIVYQKSSFENLQLPDLLVNSSFFLRFLPFKAKLPTHIGFDIVYTSYYYGYAYMPATNVFYVQNERKFGGHPYVNFFISAQRKNVRLFFKAEHVSALPYISKRNYYSAQYYPDNGFGIRFGLSWRFSD